jgi:hypothetical protein
VIEHLTSKCEALSSNPNTTKSGVDVLMELTLLWERQQT